MTASNTSRLRGAGTGTAPTGTAGCRYCLEEGCSRKKSCQYLHRDMGEEYSSSLVSRSSEKESSTQRECHKSDDKTEENENEITPEVARSDSESSFDYGLLEISDIIAE